MGGPKALFGVDKDKDKDTKGGANAAGKGKKGKGAGVTKLVITDLKEFIPMGAEGMAFDEDDIL